MKQIAPYPVLAGELTMTVHEVRLDDVALPYDMISEQDHTVGLHRVNREDWSTLRLGIRVSAPRHELDAGPWYSLAFFATASERRTNTHSAVKLMMGQPGEWTGELDLHRDDHFGRVQLSGHLVATVDEVPGRVVATVARPWIVDLQARPAAQKEAVQTRWVDFAEDPHLAWCKSDPWALTTTDEVATLNLNSGFDGLRAILESTKAAERPIREGLAAQIGTAMWTALFNEAAHQVDGRDWPEGWRGLVLRRMLPTLFPDHSPEDALRQIADLGVGGVQSRVMHAAAKQARMPRSLGGFIRFLQKTGPEDE
ncbi:hypothetical protein FLW53_16240 [Microbispora sp. SCL1-1]|uniref:hypothetical protein n=1 Tax=Microbispora TaxID=2005 RepID=UPI0011592283|nr:MULTISPECIES: hypothetical protein [unclassified Microbispora]NJP25719.1 hypothetical protein [Microbispora sp. CL1-1]TQS13213.1 hypothetical protein FLW53_16240 [Microbispora sp. SCL1-1]